MSEGRLIRLAWLGLVVAACGAPAPTPPPTANVDPTGILLIGVDEAVQIGPVPRRLANAFSDAMLLAEANGADLGYPWIDPVRDELILSVVTPRGRELVEAADITVQHHIRNVTHGTAELQGILDDVALLGARGVPGADLIVMTIPDLRDNRALIVISAMSRPLLDHLAETYPVEAIAVRIDPDAGPAIGS